MVDRNNDGKEDGPRMPRLATASLASIVLGGAVFYFWLAFRRGDSSMWSNVGQAVGPFVALLNAGALFAALYSVRLQRYELELQREELRGHREVMEEQRKQFERTAKAQERLADSQGRLADAQMAANAQTVRMEHAQRTGSAAAIRAALMSGLSTHAKYHDALDRLVIRLNDNLQAEESVIQEVANRIHAREQAELEKRNRKSNA